MKYKGENKKEKGQIERVINQPFMNLLFMKNNLHF